MSREVVGASLRASSLGWSDEPALDTLRLVAEGVAAVVGFKVATVSIVRHDVLQTVAVAGSDEARAELIGLATPMDVIHDDLAKADDWGMFKFVPAERAADDVAVWSWIPDIEPSDDPDAWHPHDLLMAPLLDEAGEISGLLSIDLPTDGRRPDAEKRRLLEAYAAQAARAVLIAVERETLAETVRLTAAARAIVRKASSQLNLDQILHQCGEAVIEGFRAQGMWIQTLDDKGITSGAVRTGDGRRMELTPGLVDLAASAAERAWANQQVGIISTLDQASHDLGSEETELVTGFLTSIGVTSMLFIPLGAGSECLGSLVLTRADPALPWTDVEVAVALDIGHDLGRAMVNARTFEREHQLVEELTALDAYKGQLIATVSHELKSPLTAIIGHLELLDGLASPGGPTHTSLAAVERGALRLERVVDDLLLLSKVGDPANVLVPAPVDLVAVVHEICDLTAVPAQQGLLTVRVVAPETPVTALGDTDELDRLVNNLVGNAVKYSLEHTTITIAVELVGEEAVLTVTDEGIGIAPRDQERLFEEFFRSADPDARAQPGTGLGLAIVRRIIDRHGGRIEVESVLGVGSTFRVFLPAVT